MKTIRCPQCNLVNWSTLDFCKRCSFDLAAIRVPEEQAAAVAGFGAKVQPNHHQNFSQPQPTNEHFPQQTQNNFPVQAHQQQQQNWGNQNVNQQGFGNGFASEQNYGNGNPNYQSRSFHGANVKTSSKMAIVSMILGIFSFPMINMFICGILAVILAMGFGAVGGIVGMIIGLALIPIGLITGIVALRKASKRPSEFGGKGFAIAGIALSGFGLVTLPMIAAIAIPNLLAARRAANEGSAISTMRTLASAEETYMATDSSKRCGDLSALGSKQLIDNVTASGTKSGYKFMIVNLPTGGCEINAMPSVSEGVSKSGERSFYSSSEEDWTIHAAKNSGKPASKSDPDIK
jgi:type IV pilus assembly protein PilA